MAAMSRAPITKFAPLSCCEAGPLRRQTARWLLDRGEPSPRTPAARPGGAVLPDPAAWPYLTACHPGLHHPATGLERVAATNGQVGYLTWSDAATPRCRDRGGRLNGGCADGLFSRQRLIRL